MCSYCGCAETPVLGGFMADHVEVVNMLGDVRRAFADGSDSDIARTTIALRRLLDDHTDSEERGLFAVLRNEAELVDTVEELIREHRLIEDVMDRLQSGDASAYDEVEHLLRRHIDKEDNGLFPAAVIALDGPGWERVVAET